MAYEFVNGDIRIILPILTTGARLPAIQTYDKSVAAKAAIRARYRTVRFKSLRKNIRSHNAKNAKNIASKELLSLTDAVAKKEMPKSSIDNTDLLSSAR